MEIEVPKLPLVFQQKYISKDAAEELLKWKEAFKKLGCQVNLEENDPGMVSFADDGCLMQVLFDGTPVDPKKDAPYGQATFYANDKADAIIMPTENEYNNWVKKLKEQQAPIDGSGLDGTWEEIYKAIVNYLQFTEKMIPLFPEGI